MNETAHLGLKWARLPLHWIHDHKLNNFPAGKLLGTSMAGLKILMAVFLRAENKAHGATTATQGSVSLSYDELMDLTDMSRSTIARGIKRLRELELITVTHEGRGQKNRYLFNNYMQGAWGKIPYRQVVGLGASSRVELLHELSCKRLSDLNALKIYLLFCAHRNGSSQYAMIGYEKISEATGVLKSRIRQAISILIEHGLIKVEQEKISDRTKNHPNRYYILGLYT